MKKSLLLLFIATTIITCQARYDDETPSNPIEASGDIVKDTAEKSGNVVHNTWDVITSPFHSCECREERRKEKKQRHKARDSRRKKTQSSQMEK